MGSDFWNGTEAAHRRVMMKAAGYSDDDIRKKPHIGVPNSYMSGSPGSAHLRQIAEAVKEGIWEAGGIPIEFGIPATCGNIANGAEELKYEQVGRDIVAMSVEFVSRVHNFDGLAMIASCDNIIAGCYLAAMRLDIPTVVVTGGSMQAGHYCDSGRGGFGHSPFFRYGYGETGGIRGECMSIVWGMSLHGNSQYHADAWGGHEPGNSGNVHNTCIGQFKT